MAVYTTNGRNVIRDDALIAVAETPAVADQIANAMTIRTKVLEKAAALTLRADECDDPYGSGFDPRLVAEDRQLSNELRKIAGVQAEVRPLPWCGT